MYSNIGKNSETCNGVCCSWNDCMHCNRETISMTKFKSFKRRRLKMSFLKKILSLIIVSVTICSTFSFFQITSNAATYVTLSQFDTALNNFKSNEYKHDSTYVDNSSYGGYQCFGFANEIAKYIFGSFPCSNMSGNNINANWTRTYGSSAVDNLHVGDIVRYRFHSIFITKIVGNTIYYCDANADGKNTVKYNKSTSKSSLKSLVGEKLTHNNATTTGWVAHYKYWKDANTLTINYSPNGATIPASNSYKVSCDGSTLSLRSTASTSGTFLISIPDNTVLTVTETKSANGYIWGRTTYGGKTGWCALDYTVRQGYYVNSNKVYRYSDSSLAKTSWEYGKGDTTYGLFNYTSFNLQKDGYNFVGWSLSTDGSTGIFGQDDTTLKAEAICPDVANSDKTVVLYAIWKPITYAVSYNANGGAGVPSAQTKIYGTALTLSSTKPTRTGYTFTGWNTNADGTGTKYAAGASYTSNAAITLYAQWTKVVLDSISIKTKPNKINYFVGETLNTSGLSLTASYSDGKTNTISSGFTCTPTTFNAAGTQKITVSYGGKSTSFNVTVENVVLSSVVVKSNPNKTTYNVGDTLNTTGLTLTATFNNGTTQTISSGFTCTPKTLSTAGTQKITVTYEGKAASFNVIVEEVVVTSLTVKTAPTKTSYYVGDTLNTNGLTLTATYNNGTTKTISSGFTCTPTTLSTVGTQKITVTYGGKTTSFDVSVAPIKITELEIVTMPQTTSYKVGDKFDPAGLTINAINNKGETIVVTDGFVCIPETLDKAGVQVVTVSYGGKSVMITVIVEEVEPETYTVRFIADGNVISETEYEVGATIVKPSAPAKVGYKFIEWDKTIPTTMPAENLIFTAQYELLVKQLKIKKPSTNTVKYGETLVMHADIAEAELPDGWKIEWTVEGTGFSTKVEENGLKFKVTSVSSGNVTVKATLVDENGEAVLDADGNEMSDSKQLKSDASFWQKIVSFFKNLFGISRIILQSIYY